MIMIRLSKIMMINNRIDRAIIIIIIRKIIIILHIKANQYGSRKSRLPDTTTVTRSIESLPGLAFLQADIVVRIELQLSYG